MNLSHQQSNRNSGGVILGKEHKNMINFEDADMRYEKSTFNQLIAY